MANVVRSFLEFVRQQHEQVGGGANGDDCEQKSAENYQSWCDVLSAIVVPFNQTHYKVPKSSRTFPPERKVS